MERALASARLSASEIDYINAHGTATPFNDAAEGKAIAELFGAVPVSSTKGMMGHSLGAAGAIEAVISLLALRDQMLPPNINFRVRTPPSISTSLRMNPGRPKSGRCSQIRSASAAPMLPSFSAPSPHEPAHQRHGLGNAARQRSDDCLGTPDRAGTTDRGANLQLDRPTQLPRLSRPGGSARRRPGASATAPIERDFALCRRRRIGGAR